MSAALRRWSQIDVIPKVGDKLLDHPLLTESEIEGLLTDVRALQEGRITGVVGSDFWERAKAEMARRQMILQIDLNRRTADATRSVATWTLRLTVFTGLLVAVTVLQAIATLLRCG